MNRNYFKWLVLAIIFVSTNNILHGDETSNDLIVRAYENSTNIHTGLDLDKFPWLYRIIPSYDYNNDTLSTGGVSGVIRIILIVIGIVLILLSLFLKSRKWEVTILLLAFITVSGCKDNTVPATFESSQQETESSPTPPLLVDPFQPRSAVNVRELSASETKTEPTTPFPSEFANESGKPETVKPEPVHFETTNEATNIEPVKPETVPSEMSLPFTPPVNDIFVQAATNQDSVTVPSGFDFVTPNPPLSEPPTTGKMESTVQTEEVKPAEPTKPATEEMTAPPLTPKEPELVATPFVSEPPLPFAPVITPTETEPFVPDPVSVTPYSVNPLRQETESSAIDVAKRNTESPAIDITKTNTELPVVGVTKANTESQAIDVVKTNTELPVVDVTKANTELPVTDIVAKNNNETPELNVLPLDAKQPFDPVAVNGELFVGWEKPKLLLVFTGFMNGYVEPCGCAGLEQMKGGLSRRYTFFKELEEKKGWQILPIDAGNLNKGFGRQEELKFNFVIDEALRLMKYQAAGIGNRELLLPTDALILYFVDVPGIPRRYTSANVAIMQFDPDFTAPYRIFEQNGVKVGVTSVIGQSFLKEVNNDDIQHEDAVKRLKEILPQFAAEKCDKRVLIIHGSAEETKRIVKSVTGQFDYVIPSDTPAEPPFRPNWMENSMLIEVGEKGKFAVAVGLYDNPNTPFRYQRVPLDSRFENSKTITALMQLYQEQLKETGFQGLGIKPIPNRRAVEGGKFVGSKSCADCHELSFQVWRKSRHANAWRSLAETSKPSRTFDPECIACHVVGWSPAEFLPYEHGFLGEKETPQLSDVGCESCHGPGENHIKAEQGSDVALQEQHRKMIRLPLDANAAKKVCIQCHDGDNSPHFDFETYWQKIVHKEQE
ncbi:MAG: hypothetical protein LBK82_13690 [Planctomycetaceae bacterium]|jgi:hypothetical protein|nr:hypothetical protein [Planctomycetaceae bacterium]